MSFCNRDIDDMEYISEEEFARSEGFYLDDDGHWIPMDDDDDEMYGYCDYDEDSDDDVCDNSDCVNQIEFARGEGFSIDDDGNWIPMDESSELPF